MRRIFHIYSTINFIKISLILVALLLPLRLYSENMNISQKPVTNNVAKHYIDKAIEITKKCALLELPLNCFTFEVLEKNYEEKITVNVREKHEGDCPGDPGTAPRRYSIEFNEKTGKVWSDARSMVAEMEVIECHIKNRKKSKKP